MCSTNSRFDKNLAMVFILVLVGCQSQSPPFGTDGSSSSSDSTARKEPKPTVPTPKFTFDKNEAVFLAEVEKAIPIGTSIEEAERILKANDFKCDRHDGSDGAPGLRATHYEPIGFLVSWQWVVWLPEENGKVTHIGGSSAGLGP